MNMRHLIIFIFLTLPKVSLGDSWVTASVFGVLSPNAEYLIRIVPGNSWGDTYGFSGAKAGEFARAIYYERDGADHYTRSKEITLVNPVRPVDVYLTNEGYLVTFDNWHNMGYGRVVVIYDTIGDLVASYTLEELYEDDEALQQLPASVSSIWWRCGDPDIQSSSFSVYEANGGRFEFQIVSGEFKYGPGEAECVR